jgi:hypothetical protein
MPICVENLVGFKQCGDTHVSRARKKLQKRVKFSVQTRSAGRVAWPRLCLCGGGSRWRTPIGGNARVGEVVCMVSILPRTRRTGQRASFAEPSTAHRYWVRRQSISLVGEERGPKRDSTLLAPHRLSMPRAPSLSQWLVRPDVSSDHGPNLQI